MPLLNDVVRLDPAFALARVSVAQALMRLKRFDEADAALREAFELEPDLPDAHLIRGQLRLRQWRFDDAERDLAYAVEHAAGESRVHHSWAYYLSVRGRHDEARHAIARARDLDPISNAVLGDAGLFEHWAGRPTEAVRRCREALAVARPEHRIRVHRCLLHTLTAMGDLEGARAHALAVLDSAGAAAAVRSEVATAPSAGAALSAYRRWGLEPANFLFAESDRSAYAHARAYAVAGELERALDALERAWRDQDPGLVQMGVEPRLDPIREDPRFQAVVRAVGLAGGT